MDAANGSRRDAALRQPVAARAQLGLELAQCCAAATRKLQDTFSTVKVSSSTVRIFYAVRIFSAGRKYFVILA